MPEPFAVMLKRMREQAGLSQAALAAKAGLNSFGVAKLEQGLRQPTLETAHALAKALGVSLSAFDDVAFAGDQPSDPAPKRGRPAKPESKPETKPSVRKKK